MQVNPNTYDNLLYSSMENPTESYNFIKKPSQAKIVELKLAPGKEYSQDFIRKYNKKSKEDSFKRFNNICTTHNQNPQYTGQKSDLDKRLERMINGMKKQANIYERHV